MVRPMRSLVTTRAGDPGVLEVREGPEPRPGPGQLLIAVQRAGLNFADVAARVGLYPDAPPLPAVLGYEVAGTVAALGEDVHGPPVGSRVLALTRFGGQASHVVVPADQAFLLPSKMSFDQAAALPVNYLTAFHLLFFVGHLRPFDRLLVHSAAGGVGLAALQLCRLGEGVEVYATASASKHALLREAGAAHVVDMRTTDHEAAFHQASGGRGLHMALNPLGGNTWRKDFRLLAPAGHLLCYGVSSLVTGEKRSLPRVAAQLALLPRWSPLELMAENKTVSGVNLGKLWDSRELFSRALSQLIRLFQDGKVSPRVDRVFPLSEAAAAHRYLQSRQSVGKVLLDVTA
jgi:NADPH:quinone reductase-like Zn-dependent oxidoreductase